MVWGVLGGLGMSGSLGDTVCVGIGRDWCCCEVSIGKELRWCLGWLRKEQVLVLGSVRKEPSSMECPWGRRE